MSQSGFTADLNAITDLANDMNSAWAPYQSAIIFSDTGVLPQSWPELDRALSIFAEGARLIRDCAAESLEQQNTRLGQAAANYAQADNQIASLFTGAIGTWPAMASTYQLSPQDNTPAFPMQRLPITDPPTPGYMSPQPARLHLTKLDVNGTLQIVEQMCVFVSELGNPTVSQINNQVNAVVKADDQGGGYYGSRTVVSTKNTNVTRSGVWLGVAAEAFYRTFISNAAIMNGFHKTLCQAAKVLEYLIVQMVELEQKAESAVLQAGVQVWPPFEPSMVYTTFSDMYEGGSKLVINLKPVLACPTTQVYQAVSSAFSPYSERAFTLYHNAATALILLSERFEQAANFYHKVSAGSLAVLTTADWTPTLSSLDNNLNAQLQGQESAVASSGSGSGFQKALQDMGIAAKAAAAIIGDAQEISSADGEVQKSVGLLSLFGDALPDLAELGLGIIAVA